MSEKKDLTLTIDGDVIKEAKKTAVDEETNLSAEVEDFLIDWSGFQR